MAVEVLPLGWWNIAGSAAIGILGIAVARSHPDRRTPLAFAGFVGLLAIVTGLSNVHVSTDPVLHAAQQTAMAVASLLAAMAVLVLVDDVMGRPRGGRFRAAQIGFGALVGGILVLPALLDLETTAAWFTNPGSSPARVTAAAGIGWLVLTGACWTAGGWLAIWARRRPAPSVRRTALLGSAILIFPAWDGGSNIGFDTAWASVYAASAGLLAILLAILWAVTAHGSTASRHAVAASLVPLSVTFAALLLHADVAFWGYGASRLAMALLLAYGIVRHKTLGLDARLRFGISKSTLAAVFITVIFVTTEAAQLLFGARNEWSGLVAAGALVFAITPIQNAADRLAERAVPSRAAGPEAMPDLEAGYRAAVRAASRKGRVSRREERHLAEAAEHLGIGALRALELRESVEAEGKRAG